MSIQRQSKKNKIVAALVTGLLLLTVNTVLNARVKAEKMSPKNAEFLSKARYIITKDEAKFFRNLPDQKRAEFIRQFWEVRDPNPDTLENEFKDEYYKRIDEANRRFTAGRDGWLTDRGKTYILLGPPTHISNYPLGAFSPNPLASTPYIIWHYPSFVVIFMDYRGDGDYRVHYLNLQHIADVQEAFIKAKQNINFLENLFEYNFKYKKIKKIPHLVFIVELDQFPFKEKDGKMVSLLEISVKIRDREYGEVWNSTREHVLAFSKTNGVIPKKYEIKIPIETKLKKGKYLFFTSLKRMDDREQERVFLNKLIKVK
jgi:GWxTD domain-containing protein